MEEVSVDLPSTIVQFYNNSFQGNAAEIAGGAIWVGNSVSILDDEQNPLSAEDPVNTFKDNSPDDIYYEAADG